MRLSPQKGSRRLTIPLQAQELNYRITVSLNSDSRSDVEGVRWIITKRAITALAACVLMVISSLKYTSTMIQWQEEEKKRLAAMNNNNNNNNNNGRNGGNGNYNGGNFNGGNFGGEHGGGQGGKGGNGGQGGEGMRTEDNMGAGELLAMEKGDNPAFVSLG